MGFDYNNAVVRVANMQTTRNIKGVMQTVSILRGLEFCPFISVIADINEISEELLYGKLKYYLGKHTTDQILEDIGERRRAKIAELKAQEKEAIMVHLGVV